MVTQKYLLTEILAFNYCVTLEQLPCADGKVDDLRDGHVDAAGGFITVPLGTRDFASKEDRIRILVVGNGPQVAHAPIADHLAGHAGRLLDVL